MAEITIPKTEYQTLKKQALAFQFFASQFFNALINDPVNQVVDDFRKTNLYTNEFLNDLDEGLRNSSWAQKYENTAHQRKIKKENRWKQSMDEVAKS